MQCTFGIRNAPLVLGMVVQHVHHPQEKETCLQGTASFATQTEEVSHVVPVRGGTGMWQPEEVCGHPLDGAAERKVFDAVRGVLVTAQSASALLLESAESRPTFEQSVQKSDGNSRRGACPSFAHGRECP